MIGADSPPAAVIDFARVLRRYRDRLGISRNQLAREVGVDASYLTRIEHGERHPPRLHVVEALARRLRLSAADRDRLLIAAGFAPASLGPFGWDDALIAVAETLADPTLNPNDRAEFSEVIRSIARRWRNAS
ncbi:MAG: helix-turn-helix domain-containing protein [Chloroflexi bacterium]|nr:helix-turn-helix domain-containing protein [Chloroflexota bacterium]